MFQDFSIKLTPYLGHSKYLMEYFIIIGVKEENLEFSRNILENEEIENLTVLSNITSNTAIRDIDLDGIIKRTYPEKPKIIKKSKSEIYPPLQSVVFSSDFINKTKDNKNKKIFYSCYALKFYEKFKDFDLNIEYYIPKAFLIISEYPYFTIFHKICLNLYKSNIEDKTIDKPVEEESIFSFKSKIVKKDEYYKSDNIPNELFIHCFVNYIPSPINKNILIKIFSNEDKIEIPNLSGYPYIDFDLYKVLNHISINDLIKSYLLMFLEFPTMLFSSDLTKLNLFMFSLNLLNYPLTNTVYLEHLRTFQKTEMEKGIKEFKTFIGVNANFSTNLNLSKYESVIFIIDIENKRLYKKNDSNEIKNLLEYINNILNNKKNVESFFLENSINILKAKIQSIKNIYNQKAKYQSNSYFFTNEKIIEINKLIQESFYDFILYVLSISNNDYHIDKNCLSLETRTKNKHLDNLSEGEKIFLKYFKITDKYKYYYNNFIKEFDAFEELKIPLLFCKEFSQLKRYDKNNQMSYNISYFKIIDNFYILNMEKDTIDINYNNLYQDLKEYYKTRDMNKNEDKQLFALDKNIINKFLFLKKNKRYLFYNLKEREKKELIIKTVEEDNITKIIQNNFGKILTAEYYIRSSFVYIFSIVFPIFSFNTCIFYLANLLDNINKIRYFQRYYAQILLKSLQKYFSANQENCQFSELNLGNIKNYCDIIKTVLNDKFILPNKEMFLFLKKMMNEQNNNEVLNNKNNTNDIFVFKYDKIENYVNTIKYDVVEKEDDLLIFKYKGKKIEYNFLSYEDIYEGAYSVYNDYFFVYNTNIEELNIKKIIHIIINLIYYLLQLEYNEKTMALFLFKTVIVLNKLEDDLKKYKENEPDNKPQRSKTDIFNKNNIINLEKSNTLINKIIDKK